VLLLEEAILIKLQVQQVQLLEVILIQHQEAALSLEVVTSIILQLKNLL